MTPTDTLLLDGDLRIRAMTARLEAALGLPPDAVGERLADVLAPDDPLVAEVRAVLAGRLIEPRVVGSAATHWRQISACRLDGGGGTDGGVVVTVTDVTAPKGREARLRKTAAEFQALVEASSQIVWRAGPDGAVTEDSPSWRAFTGQSAEGWLAGRWDEVVHPEDIGTLAEAWGAALAGRSVLDVTFRLHHAPSGAWRWVRGRAAPLVEPDGSFRGFIGMTADVHDARAADDALRTSERRFRALVEASAQIVWQTDAEGKSVGHSPTWCAYTGQTREEWLGDGWIDVVHPDDRPALFEIWQASVRAAGGYEAEFRVHHAASGGWRWMAARAAPLFRPDGAFDGHVGMNVDVTDRRAAAEALAASEARFRAMADTVPDVLFTADPRGEITYANAQFETLTGVAPAELDTLDDWLALVHPDDVEATAATWRASLASGEDAQCRYRLRTPDGGWRWVETRARAVTDPEEGVAMWYGATVDIDGLVRAERALQQANETLEARVAEETATVRRLAAELTVAEQTERRRVAQVLHDDLQQQLYAVGMLLSLVDDVPGTDAATPLRRARETVEAATSLTRTLLSDLSPTVLESADVADVARWLADEMDARYGLAVTVEASAPCRVPALAVRSLAFQGLRELLFNVVKHGGEAQAHVRLSCADGTLALVVEDDGEGFATADTEEGFGLTSLRDRLALAGGRLQVTSAPGAGTRAELALPTSPT